MAAQTVRYRKVRVRLQSGKHRLRHRHRSRDDRPAVGTEPEKRSPKLHMQPILDHVAGVVRPALRKYLAAEKALTAALESKDAGAVSIARQDVMLAARQAADVLHHLSDFVLKEPSPALTFTKIEDVRSAVEVFLRTSQSRCRRRAAARCHRCLSAPSPRPVECDGPGFDRRRPDRQRLGSDALGGRGRRRVTRNLRAGLIVRSGD